MRVCYFSPCVCVTPVFKVCLKPTGAEAETGEKEHRRLLPNRSSLHALSVFSHSGFSVYLLISMKMLLIITTMNIIKI